MGFMKDYGWTMREVDETDLLFLLDTDIVNAKVHTSFRNPLMHIEDVL